MSLREDEKIWEKWVYIVEMGRLEGIDSMNFTTFVVGNVRKMVVMGDDKEMTRTLSESSLMGGKSDREKGWKI